ncbi:hypothetical protein HAX54_024548, partial [Datura stramonium]|nr:hypothetical protein [Datura stramonium]
VTLLFSDFCNHPTSLLQICVTSKTTLILQLRNYPWNQQVTRFALKVLIKHHLNTLKLLP